MKRLNLTELTFYNDNIFNVPKRDIIQYYNTIKTGYDNLICWQSLLFNHNRYW